MNHSLRRQLAINVAASGSMAAGAVKDIVSEGSHVGPS